jgi:hypothetical protein
MGNKKIWKTEGSSKMDLSSVFQNIELTISLKCKTVAAMMSCLGYQTLPVSAHQYRQMYCTSHLFRRFIRLTRRLRLTIPSLIFTSTGDLSLNRLRSFGIKPFLRLGARALCIWVLRRMALLTGDFVASCID